MTLGTIFKRMRREWRLLAILLFAISLITGFFALGPLYIRSVTEVDLRHSLSTADEDDLRITITRENELGNDELEIIRNDLGGLVNSLDSYKRADYTAPVPPPGQAPGQVGTAVCGFNFALGIDPLQGVAPTTNCYQPFAFDEDKLAQRITVVEGRLPVRGPTPEMLDPAAWNAEGNDELQQELQLGFYNRGEVEAFVTHDRAFLKRVANQIVDLDRGKLTAWVGSYDDFLRRKADYLEQEARQQAEFDKKLAQEERWIRQGIQARRTRNEGRVRALKKMRVERADRRNKKGNVRLQMESGERSGKLVMEATDLSFAYGDQPIASNFSCRIQRGDRIGLIGPNGVGKTTLIKLLLGEIAPDSGTLKSGSNLQVAWFDQLRSQIDLDATVVDAIGEGREQIIINGKPKHVISWLSDFLFTPARARSPVRSLSGGERARVLLAKLFSKPTNLLVMDEPTNDLDIETLELLEEMLLDYDGTLLLVSHDREFMDNVVTSTFAFSGDGIINEYVGGYSDWERQRPLGDKQQQSVKPAAPVTPVAAAPVAKKKKLSYREQQELEQLPSRIEALEQQQEALTAKVSDAAFYQQDSGTVEKTLKELDQVTKELDTCIERWDELES